MPETYPDFSGSAGISFALLSGPAGELISSRSVRFCFGFNPKAAGVERFGEVTELARIVQCFVAFSVEIVENPGGPFGLTSGSSEPLIKHRFLCEFVCVFVEW